MNILNAHIQLIATAQAEYQQAIAKQSAPGVEFWLEQMKELIVLLKDLEPLAGPPVLKATNNANYDLKQLQKQLDNTPAQVVSVVEVIPPLPPQPTIYAWNDGFEGVSLEDVWDR